MRPNWPLGQLQSQREKPKLGTSLAESGKKGKKKYRLNTGRRDISLSNPYF